MSKDKSKFPYLHGFSNEEQERLREQARYAEQSIYQNIDFSKSEKIIEVGCGVGAQTEILLRRFPDLSIQGIDLNTKQLESANHTLELRKEFEGRYRLEEMNASKIDFKSNSFDGAFLCWILEHVPSPSKVLNEVRRVMKPGSQIYITEVMNQTFFLEPYSPNVWKYWQAFNDYQYDNAGDPFVGAKLGNLLSSVGFQEIHTDIRSWHYDNRDPDSRKEFIDFWTKLLMSGAEQLLKAGVVTEEIVKEAEKELGEVASDPNSVFMYSYMQAKARKI